MVSDYFNLKFPNFEEEIKQSAWEYFTKLVIKEASLIHPKLPRDIDTEVELKGNRLILIATYKARPWRYYLHGTRPHYICARLWRQCGTPSPLWKGAHWALRYISHGEVKIRRWTYHPGFKGKKGALKRAQRRILSNIQANLKKEILKTLLGEG